MTIEDDNAHSACQDICDQFKGEFTTGFGKFFTLKEDGKHPDKGSSYHKISLPEIMNSMANPTKVEKHKAQWIIPSSHNSSEARSADEQKKFGKYWALVADIDKSNPNLALVIESTKQIFGDVFFLVWATPSCKPDDQRWRVLIPLSKFMNYRGYRACQTLWFREMGNHTIACDLSFINANQYLYLPNQGEFYTSYTHISGLLDLENWQHIEEAITYDKELFLQEKQMEKRREEREHDPDSPMANVCRVFDTIDVMLAAGYEMQPGKTDQLHVVGGTEGDYGVKVYPNDRWTSRHDTDAEAGNPNGDVCDIFERYHGWTRKDTVSVGFAVRAGFNPIGIPYHAVPAAVANWCTVLPFPEVITVAGGKTLNLSKAKENRQNGGGMS